MNLEPDILSAMTCAGYNLCAKGCAGVSACTADIVFPVLNSPDVFPAAESVSFPFVFPDITEKGIIKSSYVSGGLGSTFNVRPDGRAFPLYSTQETAFKQINEYQSSYR